MFSLPFYLNLAQGKKQNCLTILFLFFLLEVCRSRCGRIFREKSHFRTDARTVALYPRTETKKKATRKGKGKAGH